MSHLENTKIEEKLIEEIQNAFNEDIELQDLLAQATLGPWGIYAYAMDGNKNVVNWNKIEEELVKTFWDYEFQCIDVRGLAEKAYNVEFQ